MPVSENNLGGVKAGSGKTFEVKWNSGDKKVYVKVAGWTYAGLASSAGEAMQKAEAFVYNK